MRCVLGHGEGPSASEAVRQACLEMDGMRPSLVLFFSDDELFPDVARELSRRFPAATVIGASTFASFSPGDSAATASTSRRWKAGCMSRAA